MMSSTHIWCTRPAIFLLIFLYIFDAVRNGAHAFIPSCRSSLSKKRCISHKSADGRAPRQPALHMAKRGRSQTSRIPKLVVFDLDGCLWRPEMYELAYRSGGASNGAPFVVSPKDDQVLLTCKGEPVKLLGDVRDVMRELYTDPKWKGTQVGISSRTDRPDWARELLTKFKVRNGGESFVLDDVIAGPVEISYETKVKHFRRLAKQTGIDLKDMIFFDNEYGNCGSVSQLGVTVGYCPRGVTQRIWDKVLQKFPARAGAVVEL